jgi:DNA-directed RNA polymerase subunit M/transcription elongation factor TFIIS
METLDPGAEYLRIAERYRQMSDEELVVLVPQSSELTEFAQQALASEVRSRGLKVEAAVEDGRPSAASRFGESTVKPRPAFFEYEPPRFRDTGDLASADSLDETESPYTESPYEEDRKLVDLCTVYSVRDALRVQAILDQRGIPFFMGPEKATGVDAVTSDFTKGVEVRIMQIGMFWARAGMGHYEPEDDPTPKEPEEPDEMPVRCPKCHSEEVIFEGRAPVPGKAADESSHEFKWSCDSCGYRWEDDGVAKEA